MRSIGKIYLDTNIFILAFEHNDLVSDLLGRILTIKGNTNRFATSELTLSELLVKPFRQADESTIRSYQAMIVGSEWLNVLPVGRPVLQHAARLRANYPSLKLPDAIHISTAFASECTHMLTDDGGLRGAYDISGESTTLQHTHLTVLRPDEPTLTSLIKSLSP